LARSWFGSSQVKVGRTQSQGSSRRWHCADSDGW